MKISSKLTVLSSVAALVAGPYALGNEPEMVTCEMFPVAELPPVELVTPTLAECWVVPPGPLPTGEPIDFVGPTLVGEGIVNEVTDEKVVITDPIVDVVNPDDGAVVDLEVTGIPIDWVKRTDGDGSEVIYQNMAGPVPTSAAGGNSPIARGTEQDEQSTAIVDKSQAAASQIDHEKQGPVAVVNAGRVFLR